MRSTSLIVSPIAPQDLSMALSATHKPFEHPGKNHHADLSRRDMGLYFYLQFRPAPAYRFSAGHYTADQSACLAADQSANIIRIEKVADSSFSERYAPTAYKFGFMNSRDHGYAATAITSLPTLQRRTALSAEFPKKHFLNAVASRKFCDGSLLIDFRQAEAR